MFIDYIYRTFKKLYYNLLKKSVFVSTDGSERLCICNVIRTSLKPLEDVNNKKLFVFLHDGHLALHSSNDRKLLLFLNLLLKL